MKNKYHQLFIHLFCNRGNKGYSTTLNLYDASPTLEILKAILIDDKLDGGALTEVFAIWEIQKGQSEILLPVFNGKFTKKIESVFRYSCWSLD